MMLEHDQIILVPHMLSLASKYAAKIFFYAQLFHI